MPPDRERHGEAQTAHHALAGGRHLCGCKLRQGAPERHFRDRDDHFVHRQVPYLLMKRTIAGGKAMTMPKAQRKLGLVPWMMAPKERRFLDLGHRASVPSRRP